MTSTASPTRYPRALQILHWALSLLICVQFALILVLRQLQSLEFGQLVLGLHRQCGALVLILILVRLGLAFRMRAPKSEPGLPTWQKMAASVVHLALFAALAAQPILGFLVAWSRGDSVVLFGVLKLPTLIQLTNEQGVALGAWHAKLAYAMLALLAVHLGAVVFNRVMRKVSVVERMMPAPPVDRLVNRVPLTVQLTFCCGAILAMSLAAGLYGAGQYTAFNKLRAAIDETDVAVLDEMRSTQLAVKALAADPSQAASQAASVQAYPDRLSDPVAKAAAAASAQALARIAGGDTSPTTLTEAETQLQSAVDSQFMIVFQRRLDIAETAAKGHDMIVLTLAPTVMLSAVLAFLLSRSILSALARARAVVRRVEEGEAAEALKVIGDGEFSGLMRDILRMRDRVMERQSESYAFQMEQRAKMEAQAREQQAHEADLAREHAAEQSQIVDTLAGGLSSLAGGDLTVRIDQVFPGQYDRLRTDFNAAVAGLEATVRTITEAALSIGGGSSEIARAAGDLSNRTEGQAASLQETATALDEITATVRKSAAGARQAAEVVASARSEADQSNTVVGEAIQAMGDIEASSSQISQIIGVIDEIAFQTNLLALNAGIEAARAGESGRGFAVVAQEVRALAQRSAEAAKEIKVLISASGRQVETGVELVGRTGQALRRIVDKVGEIDALVAGIASTARDQATGLDQVNDAVNHMDSAVQQNAAMVEETTAAVVSLDDSVDMLSNLMRQFSVGASSGAEAPPVRRRA